MVLPSGRAIGTDAGEATKNHTVNMVRPTISRSMSAAPGTAAHRDSARVSEDPRDKSIVVGLDGRQHDADALALAETLREAFAGQVVLVHVLPEAPLLGPGMAEFQMAQRRDGQQLLTEAVARVEDPVETELLSPLPAALALERIAFKRHASLVVLGSSHRSAIGQIVPGAVALRLLRGAPCPVAVAPAGYANRARGRITGVGVAYDATTGSEKALQAAASAAGRLRVPLYVYHAIPYDELDELSRAQMINYGKVILDRAREQLPPWVNPRLRELSGDPANAILEAVGEDDVGLLFAGSRGRGPLREGLFGGVSHALLQSAPCAVVLIPREARIAAGRGAQ